MEFTTKALRLRLCQDSGLSTMGQAFLIFKVNGTCFEINTPASAEFFPSSPPPQVLSVDVGILLKLLFHQKKLYTAERKCFKHTVMLAKTVSFS